MYARTAAARANSAQAAAEDRALATARSWLECFNDGDREGFRAHMHPEVVFVRRALDRVERGADLVEASYWQWRDQFLGLFGEIDSGFGNGERAAIETCWTGIFKPARREITFRACSLLTVCDGGLLAIVDYYDPLSFQRQLGQA